MNTSKYLHSFPFLLQSYNKAYYLDYQEKRNEYVDAFFSKLVHWAFAEENLNRVVTTRDEL